MYCCCCSSSFAILGQEKIEKKIRKKRNVKPRGVGLVPCNQDLNNKTVAAATSASVTAVAAAGGSLVIVFFKLFESDRVFNSLKFKC